MNLVTKLQFILVLVHLDAATTWKMFYRGIPVAVKTFYSATADEVKKEVRVMFNLKHLNFPLLLGVCTVSKPYLLVSSFYNVSDKSYTMYSVLKSSNLSLAMVAHYSHKKRT